MSRHSEEQFILGCIMLWSWLIANGAGARPRRHVKHDPAAKAFEMLRRRWVAIVVDCHFVRDQERAARTAPPARRRMGGTRSRR